MQKSTDNAAVLRAVVVATSRRSCPVVSTQMTGFFSSSTAVDSGVGIESCPWTIHVEQGRRVNITLFNFVDRLFNCEDWNIIIREGNETVEVSVCFGMEEGGPNIVDIDQGARERVKYTSRGGTIILIYLASATASGTVFESPHLRSTPLLLRYNGLFYRLSTVYPSNTGHSLNHNLFHNLQ